MAAEASTTTMSMAGVIPMPNQQLHLLPLLQPTSHTRPPLDRLPQGDPSPSRVAFSIADRRGGSTDWISTTHVFPSAYPRSHYASTVPPSAPVPAPDASRASQDREADRVSRKADFETWEDMTNRYSAESLYPPSSEEEAQKLASTLAESNQPQLWGCVQRIVPSRPVEGGITLFLAHANGFHKEIYEPTVQSIINTLESKGKDAPSIGEVWSIDAFYSGDAAELNRGSLGQSVSWYDHPRDIRQFLDFYLPVRGAAQVPTVLEVHEPGATRKGRTMVGVGHSFSGAGLVMLSSIFPDFFSGLFVIDPIGVPLEQLVDYPIQSEVPLARGAVARKDVFASRREAGEYLLSKPFFQAWDPRVLDLHLRFGFVALAGHEGSGDPPVTLKTSKWCEALAFSTSYLASMAHSQIDRSGYSGWAHLICTGEGANSLFGHNGLSILQDKFTKSFSTSGRTTTEVIPGGHLVAQDQPDLLGQRLAQVLVHNHQNSRAQRTRL